MRIATTLTAFVLGGVWVGSAGCASPTTNTDTDTSAPPPFTDMTGQATTQLPAYPPLPYGLGIGSVVENFEFTGFLTPQTGISSTELVRMSDFYNPHGKDPSYQPAEGEADDRLFPQGTAKEGQLKPTALLINVGSVWCGPCNHEAEEDLPPKYIRYAPCGGEFLLQLADGPTPGKTATEKNLTNWIKKYHVDYPSVIDPAYQLQPLFQAVAYPQNILIDTTTMKIVKVFAGEAVSGLCSDGISTCEEDADCSGGRTCNVNSMWTSFESLLDKTRDGCTLP
jgi:hypothetical protein